MAIKVGYARNAARGLLKDVQISEYPISVNKIAKFLNLSLWEYDQFPDSISALLRPNEKAIAVNPKHIDERKRFSIAHEIGHYVLGHCDAKKESAEDGEDFLSQQSTELKYSGEEESEANEFAAELLMPLHFVVSEQAMWIRLSKLNLIKYL
jgi:Zn-dependent peptidase ImmA (M78 family)